jgi:hypothetical protein
MNSTTLSPKKDKNLWVHFSRKLIRRVSTGSGTFGWIATHVQRKMVVRQLHIMPNSVLQLSMFLHVDEEFTSSTVRTWTGKARTESNWMMKRRKSMLNLGKGPV